MCNDSLFFFFFKLFCDYLSFRALQVVLKPVPSVALNSRNNWFFQVLRKSVIYVAEVWHN